METKIVIFVVIPDARVRCVGDTKEHTPETKALFNDIKLGVGRIIGRMNLARFISTTEIRLMSKSHLRSQEEKPFITFLADGMNHLPNGMNLGQAIYYTIPKESGVGLSEDVTSKD